MIRVLLAEDQAMVRGALAALLSREEDIEVVAEVARGDAVTQAALTSQPDVALLDIEMPGGSGLQAAQALRMALPSCRVVMLTTFGRSGYLRQAMENGAVGFLLKDAPAKTLAAALRRVMKGERVVDTDFALIALSEGSNPLTNREREVLTASLFGASLAEIATRLLLSEGTVRNHLSSAMQKLDAQNRMEAARQAEQKGWL
jgi:two-component system response regulator DesR